jgi:hypothetical protein
MQIEGTETLAGFGHHPDPAIDFCFETESIANEWGNLKIDFLNRTPRMSEVETRLSKALSFDVGADRNAMGAKSILRKIEAEMRGDTKVAFR